MIKIKILGDPIAQKRPRFTKSGFTYSPGQKEKNDFRVMIQEKAPEKLLMGALEVNMTFAFKRPKSHYRTGKNSHLLKNSAPIFCTNRKDLDNIFKFYADAMNKIIYEDDSQIIRTCIHKKWTKEAPYVEIEIEDYERNL